MALELKGTKTEQNLMAAFAGESQARNKYTYFASVAKKEGYEQIAEIFLKTAENEKEHAKLWANSALPLKTWLQQLQAKTTNGPICTTLSQEKLKKKASRLWHSSSEQ